MGGGFGRRLETCSIEQVLALAMQAPFPLQIVWPREEEIRQDFYRPSHHDRIRATLGPDGLPHALGHRTVGASVTERWAPAWIKDGLDLDTADGIVEMVYTVPRRHLEWDI